MMRGPPVVVVEIGEVTAVGGVAQYGAERATIGVVIDAAMHLGGGVSGIEDRYRHAVGAFGDQLAQDIAVAAGHVNADQYLDAAGEVLGINGAYRARQRIAQNGGDNDSRVKGRL